MPREILTQYGIAVATSVVIAIGMVFLVIASTMPPPLLTVKELRDNPFRWNGRKVKVRGWLSIMRGEEGGLTISSRRVVDWEQEKRPPFTPSLGFGGGDSDFYAAADRLLYREVVITARFDAECFQPNIVCLGSSDLVPIVGEPIRPVR